MMLLEAEASTEVAVEKLADHRIKGSSSICQCSTPVIRECLCEKVLKVKADVAAVLSIF
jgi:hypothetical protein